jgi:hypothetical protein
MVNDTTGHHETRIKGSSGNSTKWMPRPVIKPIPEIIESMLHEIFCCSEVEPRIDCISISWSPSIVGSSCAGVGGLLREVATDIRG